MYKKPKLHSTVAAPVGANTSGAALSPPRSYSHPLKHRKHSSSPPADNAAITSTSQKENITTNYVLKEQQRETPRRTKQQRVEVDKVLGSEHHQSETQRQNYTGGALSAQQHLKGKQSKQQQDTYVPNLLQVVRSKRPALETTDRSISWSSAGETISSLSNSFDKHTGSNSNRHTHQRDQFASALTSLLPSSYTKNISNNNNAAVSSVITTDQKPMSFLSKHILRRDSKKSNPSAGSSILTDNTTDTTSKSDSNNYFLNMFRCSPNFDGAAPYSQDQCSSIDSSAIENSISSANVTSTTDTDSHMGTAHKGEAVESEPISATNNRYNNNTYSIDENITKSRSSQYGDDQADEQSLTYQSLAKLTSPAASPVNRRRNTNRENFAMSPAAATNRSISWWDEPESGEGGNSPETINHSTAMNFRINDGLYGISKKIDSPTELSPNSLRNSSSSHGIIKVSDDSSESENPRYEEDNSSIRKNKVSETPMSPTSPASRQNRTAVKPARLIIERDESIVDVLLKATSRVFQQLCAA